MELHPPETQTLYAQLFELVVSREIDLELGFANGLAVERQVKGHAYLYWQMRDLEGRLKQVYLGPKDDERAIALRDRFVSFKKGAARADVERLTAAYIASGGATNIGTHFKVVDALARAGLFRAGAVLVGSHAFVSIGASLGVTWSALDAATADVDLCRDEFVSVACDEVHAIDVPGVLKSVDPTFFLIPEFDLKTPSTSMASRDKKIKVDLLTTAKTPRDTKPRIVAPFGLGAQPLRYMDYLVRHGVQRSLFIGKSAVLVNVPEAGRFAVHKLAIAMRRHETSIKSGKDIRQADALILALADLRPGALGLAMRAATKHHDGGLIKDVRAAAKKLPEKTRAALGI